jgi:hypothetical protein
MFFRHMFSAGGFDCAGDVSIYNLCQTSFGSLLPGSTVLVVHHVLDDVTEDVATQSFGDLGLSHLLYCGL